MKIRIVLPCLLVVGSAFAQTAPSPAASAPPPAQEKPAANEARAIDPAKEADIRRLMDMTGAGKVAVQMMNGMEKNIRPMMVNSFPPGAYREKLIELFFAKFHTKAGAKQILDLSVPIYNKYYTHAEIKAMIQFYGTPLGKKMLLVQPKLVDELQDVGTTWGENVGRESMSEVLAEHPELEQALNNAKKGTAAPE